MYPKIFAEKFPTQESLKRAIDDCERRQPKIRPALLPGPKSLLRKLR